MNPRDPSPEEIELICLEIQATWTERERMSRLRVDLRPTFTRCDGERLEMTSEAYSKHHSEREAMAGMETPGGD